MRLFHLEDLKDYLGKDHPTEDVHLEFLVRTVSARVEGYLGRELLKAAKTEVLDVHERQKVFRLKAIPVDLSQSFTVKNDPDQDWAGATAEDATNYVVQAAYGRLHWKRDYTLLDGPQSLQVAYTGGLAATTDDVPDAIQTAAKMFAAEIWRRRKALGATSESIGGFSVTSEKALRMPEIVAEMLFDYRTPWAKMGKAWRP
jgi:uncharacterized phiE125 gp8 family phage protein